MANNKTGFDYYNVDTDRYLDKRIKRLKKSFGCTGIAVYDFILSEIYREKGCFITWDEDTAFDVAEYYGLKETTVNEIVQYCCFVGLFNKELLAGEGVLSSHSIQKRFTEMSIRAKRKCYEIPEKIKILTEESTIVPEEPADTSGDLPQSKVKKSKVKKSKVLGAFAPTPEQKTFFKNFQKFIQDEAPNVGRMKQPFTIDEYLKLKIEYRSEQIKVGVKKMHNYKPLLQKNVSAYLTFLNWFSEEKSSLNKKEINQDAAEGQRIQEERSREIIGG